MDKVQGLAITTDIKMFVSTEIDGENDSLCGTFLWSIGKIIKQAFYTKFGEEPKRKFLGVPLQFKPSEIAVRRAVRIESFNLHSQRKIHLNKNGFDFI